jgi:hypothetical protein
MFVEKQPNKIKKKKAILMGLTKRMFVIIIKRLL